jgi:hypothetical protein
LNFFGLFGVRIHCVVCSLVSTFANKIQVLSRFSCTVWLKNSSPSLWHHYEKSKSKPLSAFCAHPWAFSESILHKTCGSLSYLW